MSPHGNEQWWQARETARDERIRELEDQLRVAVASVKHWRELPPGRSRNRQLLEIADELDAVAEREESALGQLEDMGVEISEYNLNFPEEQRRHAATIRRLA